MTEVYPRDQATPRVAAVAVTPAHEAPSADAAVIHDQDQDPAPAAAATLDHEVLSADAAMIHDHDQDQNLARVAAVIPDLEAPSADAVMIRDQDPTRVADPTHAVHHQSAPLRPAVVAAVLNPHLRALVLPPRRHVGDARLVVRLLRGRRGVIALHLV